MKISLDGQNMVLKAESLNDNVALMTLYSETEAEVQVKRTHKRHKKHLFVKKCDICGKSVKGQAGMSQHMRWMHRSPMRKLEIN